MDHMIPSEPQHEGTSESYAKMLEANRIKTEEAKNPPELSEELIEPLETIGEADMAPLDEEEAEDLPESAIEEAEEGDMKKTG